MINDEMAADRVNPHHTNLQATQINTQAAQAYVSVSSVEQSVSGAQASTSARGHGGFEGEDGNPTTGREGIMVIRKSDKIQEIKERCFHRLNMERQNLIRKRRQQSGFGTYSKVKNSGIFETPSNKAGVVSKSTRQVAEQVDQDLLNDHEGLMARILDEEKEQLPELSVDEWNEIYIEIQQDMTRMLALQLLEDRKQDVEYDYELNQMFSQLAIEVQAETLDPDNNDSAVCALCKSNVVRRIRGSRITCELQGCLNIDLHFDDFRVEDIMIKLCQMMDEHKRHAAENNHDCHRNLQQRPQLELVLLSEDFEFQQITPNIALDEKQSLAVFMECDTCKFLDFSNVF